MQYHQLIVSVSQLEHQWEVLSVGFLFSLGSDTVSSYGDYILYTSFHIFFCFHLYLLSLHCICTLFIGVRHLIQTFFFFNASSEAFLGIILQFQVLWESLVPHHRHSFLVNGESVGRLPELLWLPVWSLGLSCFLSFIA